MHAYRKLWFTLIAILALTSSLLGYYGTEIYRQAPPIPAQGELQCPGSDAADRFGPRCLGELAPRDAGVLDGRPQMATDVFHRGGFWNMLGVGVFGFMINPQLSLYYILGLNTTPAHAHAALFGVYGFLALGLTLLVLRPGRRSSRGSPTCRGSRQPIEQLPHGAIDGFEPMRACKHHLRRLDEAAFDDLIGAVGDDLLGAGRRRFQVKLQADDALVVHEGLIRATGTARDMYRAGRDVKGISVPVKNIDLPGECGKQPGLGRGLRRFDRKPADFPVGIGIHFRT